MEENLYYYCLAFIFSILITIKFVFTRKPNLPPSPFALPIIGHLHLIKKPPLYKTLDTLLSKYGPILYLKFGSRSLLVLSSPSAVEECFTKNDIIFANRPRTMAGDHFTYDYTVYVWAPYGHLWRNLRRLTVVEVFSSTSLQKSAPILEDEVRNILGFVFKLHSISGNKKVELNLKVLFSSLTVNVMMRIIAGKRGCEYDIEVAEKFYQEFKELFYPTMAMTLCDFLPILRWIGYKGIEKGFIEFQRKRDKYLQNLIDEFRLKKTNNDGKKKMSLIETLLSLQESDPESYPDEVLKSILLLMFVAGVDTSIITLEWAMTLLLNHPEALQKLRAEIDSNVGQGRMIRDSDLIKLPYLRSVVNETLRLYPPSPLLVPHLSSENCVVGGYNIPRGTMLVVNAWAMHMNPKLWEEPTKFKPERFEVSSEERVGFKYIPFGMGRRACPGAAMSTRTVSLTLGSLIQCFEWERVGQDVDINEHYGLSLSKANPLVAMCNPSQKMIQPLSQL